jgi:7,8-dihydropterin-6-yl-methyl-4-(beta-D-ribofuranosyl)aminobenzene 5'-phosphate synthase
MVTEFEQIDRGLFVLENGNWAPDQLMDDRALIIKHDGGLVVVLGCAHRGMINTLYHARSITGVDRIHAVIGGSHLMNTPEERIWSTIAAIREMDIEKVGLCHCTDLPATTVLAHELGERFIFNKAGSVIEIP